jgi:T5SS/PEP-CTERM-associated repeat protein
MKTTRLLRVLTLWSASAFLLLASPARAEDNTTMTVDGVTSNVGGAFTWGNSGANNQLLVTNGGTLVDTTATLGNLAAARDNQASVMGAGSIWSNTSTFTIGAAGSYNQLTVGSSGTLKSVGLSVIGGDNTTGNVVTVTGSGSLWTNAANSIRVGSGGLSNQLIVSDGAAVVSANLYLGNNLGSRYNKATVTGANSLLSSVTTLSVGNNGTTNELAVLDGGKLFVGTTTYFGQSAGSHGNSAVVSGANSYWTNGADIRVGQAGYGNRLVVSNGGRVTAASGTTVGRTGSHSNLVLVADSGSLLEGNVTVGSSSMANQLVVSNGGKVAASTFILGSGATAFGNVLTITGQGSTLTNSSDFTMGNVGSSSNRVFISDGGQAIIVGGFTVGNAAGTNRVEITSGGLLHANTLTVGNYADNALSNAGGIFQFSTAAPTISPNGYGRISLTDGTIAHRAIGNADVRGSLGANQLGNILYAGNNVFRLNNASNWTALNQNYTFASGVSPSNYAGLEMINAATAWKSAWLNVGSGGSMLVSNTAAVIAGVVSNSGQIRVVNSTATWLSNFVGMGGSFTSLASTNTFSGALAVNAGATLGGSGRVATPGAVVAGTLSPGNSPGTLSFSSNLTLTAASTLVLEIAGTNSADYDHLLVDGVFARNGTLTVTNLGHTFADGDTFDFFDVTAWSGAFSATNLPTLTGGLVWDFANFDTTGTLAITMLIPEPGTFAAAAAGLALLVVLSRRKTS